MLIYLHKIVNVHGRSTSKINSRTSFCIELESQVKFGQNIHDALVVFVQRIRLINRFRLIESSHCFVVVAISIQMEASEPIQRKPNEQVFSPQRCTSDTQCFSVELGRFVVSSLTLVGRGN